MSNPELTSQIRTSPWYSMVMSFLVHFLLVTFLFLFVFSSTRKGTEGELRRTGIVLATIPNENQTEYLDETDLNQQDQAQEVSASTPASIPPPALNNLPENDSSLELPGFESSDSPQLDANTLVDIDSNARLDSQYELSQDDLKLIEADQKLLQSRAPKGNPTTISVFGSGGLNGRSFVFVLDRSKSMGTGGLGVIQAAKKELSHAIGQLQSNHSFQIVGYNQRTVTMKHRQMLPANDANKLAVSKFIGTLSAFGATNHENGLVAAAVFRPDIIVLLTDGGHPVLHDGKLKQLKRAFSRSEVHCIQFGVGSNQKPMNFMRKLAEQNGGTFRYIDVTKWDQD